MGNIVTVDFRSDTLFAVERDDGVFVALKPIVQSLGLDWKAQHRRLSDDPILREGMVTMTIPSVGGMQETTCLRLDLVNGWLFTIDESRVKDEEVRQRVLTYKRECYSVLFQHFYGKRGRPAREDEGELLAAETAKVRIVNEARHVFGAQAAAQLWVKLGLPIAPAMMHDPRQLAFINLDTVKTEQGAA
ncbi:phage antirepressor N-terminal domain-containing protein [Xanthobacter flavus]|uniref:phage antirepressor N-terminal domain-containing protein n=1 Tax=Xanthobacter flavus TaxID=281 RepID=UPI0037279CB0